VREGLLERSFDEVELGGGGEVYFVEQDDICCSNLSRGEMRGWHRTVSGTGVGMYLWASL
jgi:hypothetical protein